MRKTGLADLDLDALVLRQTLSVVDDAVSAEDTALRALEANPLWERARAVQGGRVILLDRFLFTGGVYGVRAAADQLRREFTALPTGSERKENP